MSDRAIDVGGVPNAPPKEKAGRAKWDQAQHFTSAVLRQLKRRSLLTKRWSDLTSRRCRIPARQPAVVFDDGWASQRVGVNALHLLTKAPIRSPGP